MPAIFIEETPERYLPMTSVPWDSEAILQQIVAEYPGLIAGETDESANRYALVKREIGVPDDDGAADRFSLDHLFVDQAGVPTLVEVKRSSDTRIRREVVGQLLDYAANGVLHWGEGRLRAEFEARYEDGGAADALLQAGVIADATDVDRFWSTVDDNLSSGHLRLVFVADEIPHELRSIVEFLNEQMTMTEVLALEVQRYQGAKRTVLTATVIGNTARAESVKGSASQAWSIEEVIASTRRTASPQGFAAAEGLIALTQEHGRLIAPRTQNPSASGVLPIDGKNVKVWHLVVWGGSSPSIQIAFGSLVDAGIDEETVRRFVAALGPWLGPKLADIEAKGYRAWPYLELRHAMSHEAPDALVAAFAQLIS